LSHYEAYRRTLTPVIRRLYRVEVRGQEHVPLTGPLVVAGNHESILDPFLLAAVIPRQVHFIGKSEFWRYRPLRWWLGTVGAIPVVRGGGDVAAVASAIEALDAGEAVGLFPEGGVNWSGPWKRGAARMALATGAPLLPVRLLDVRRAMGRGSFGFPPLAALIGEPIPVERAEPTEELARELTDRLQAAVAALGA
jgi:1-acyl-sn-glycerol-3-phosphate acyltransferase